MTYYNNVQLELLHLSVVAVFSKFSTLVRCNSINFKFGTFVDWFANQIYFKWTNYFRAID
ncbi:hypothetical protein T02_11952 [Trichinella nativa]|uniref:Uncharacterized protein n=1 Tax=Trichinella nativa TaxID=6335 RepID=A0A0V1KS08_9BILA|nr:hypothetical protein T02_11952 [Trichinella nativa]